MTLLLRKGYDYITDRGLRAEPVFAVEFVYLIATEIFDLVYEIRIDELDDMVFHRSDVSHGLAYGQFSVLDRQLDSVSVHLFIEILNQIAGVVDSSNYLIWFVLIEKAVPIVTVFDERDGLIYIDTGKVRSLTVSPVGIVLIDPFVQLVIEPLIDDIFNVLLLGELAVGLDKIDGFLIATDCLFDGGINGRLFDGVIQSPLMYFSSLSRVEESFVQMTCLSFPMAPPKAVLPAYQFVGQTAREETVGQK